MNDNRNVPGFIVPAVEDWISVHIPELVRPFAWDQLTGGHSNLTYRLTDARGRKAVIRRPPEGKLLPRAHDMSREWKVLTALSKTQVPAPTPLGFCESPDVTGAWFYVMDWVDGIALHTREDVERYVPQASRYELAMSHFEALAALHTVDPDAVGLGDLGRKDGYLQRQIKTWYQSWLSSRAAADHDDPRAHHIKDFLENNIPAQGAARIVHGDCALHNVLVGPDNTVAVILDWEMATLGDPLSDFAYALNSFPRSLDQADPKATTSAPGFPSRDELSKRYAERTGADLANLDYYLAFNNWKGAAIIHGVRARYMAGAKSTEGVDLDALKQIVERGLSQASSALERLR